ncbi:beta-galactosidase [Alteribacter aurantiacus]|uniref:beta-galactosidase n=1 Tax=Alteribacter aurantiacus TaxID=254410 RepID=UPI000404F8DF|nr:beta-galactosidase [Alteribacter aurantiacus]
MIEITNKQIVIDGKPQIILSGEIHYYRLDRKDWQDRIDKLKMAGGNAVASYIPWLCHEPAEGQVDLTGETKEELDLAGFIDLCHENGLYFFARPGPFIMAEMKNEGIPYWVYEKHPESVPVGWDGQEVTTPTLDYLYPGFLEETRKWYNHVMEILRPRLYQHGGPIIALQLDNEVGMLSWVSNVPDLTENVITGFREWLHENYDSQKLRERYPFDLSNLKAAVEAVRSPKEDYVLYLQKDLGYFMRHRFAKYIATLKDYAQKSDVKDIPYIVNIHGTGGGRGFTYPIGISQLYESYIQDEDLLAGSDIYFGDLDMNTFQDLYLINGFMEAVNLPHQPLTSVEFNCGDGNFGQMVGERYDPSAADFKARMCIAQGNRLLNYYLFCGGRNGRFDVPEFDGNNRIASTGERHGFAAPVSPEGEFNYTFDRMAQSMKAIMAVSDKLAAMNEERDQVTFGFIPDYYMTEYRYPKSKKTQDLLENLEKNRAGNVWEALGRALLLANFRFTSADVQNKPLSPADIPVLVLPSAKYMAKDIQDKLVTYLEDGGRLLLYGEVPQLDMEGHHCSVLADALGATVIGEHRGDHRFYLSVASGGWAEQMGEIRTHFAQALELESGDPILTVYGTSHVTGFETEAGAGKAVVIAAAMTCDIEFFKKCVHRLGAEPGLTHDCREHGIFMTSVKNDAGERFLHLLNLDGFDKKFTVYKDGLSLFDGEKVELHAKEGVMLPYNVEYADVNIVSSTAEIAGVEPDGIRFRLTQAEDRIRIKTDKTILSHESYTVKKDEEDTYLIRSNKHAKVDNELTVFIPGLTESEREC